MGENAPFDSFYDIKNRHRCHLRKSRTRWYFKADVSVFQAHLPLRLTVENAEAFGLLESKIEVEDIVIDTTHRIAKNS